MFTAVVIQQVIVQACCHLFHDILYRFFTLLGKLAQESPTLVIALMKRSALTFRFLITLKLNFGQYLAIHTHYS